MELDTIATLTDQEQPRVPATGTAERLSKILLVDDNRDTLRTIAKLLRSSGFDVRTAASVGSALAVLDGERFDLLVSDIGLPDGSGLDIMRHGRDHLGLKGIAFSGYGMDQDVRASKEAGFAPRPSRRTSASGRPDQADGVVTRLPPFESDGGVFGTHRVRTEKGAIQAYPGLPTGSTACADAFETAPSGTGCWGFRASTVRTSATDCRRTRMSGPGPPRRPGQVRPNRGGVGRTVPPATPCGTGDRSSARPRCPRRRRPAQGSARP